MNRLHQFVIKSGPAKLFGPGSTWEIVEDCLNPQCPMNIGMDADTARMLR